MIKSNLELLSPAGTYECFLAALSGGADAVYLGLKDFGARRNAGNFTEEELLKALEEAHLRNVKIYLTVNTLFKDNEFDDLYNALINPYLAGLDGVIVQDLGVASFIKEHFPKMPIHASTQMAITDVSGALFAKNLGIDRIVPARELSLKEIKNIKNKADIEIECFIHGALCYSYSGKCLFSSFLGDRSGNRGLCAQPCRLPYNGKYLLSMKDLCAIEYIPELIKAGVVSFKIEGRMKSPEYVYNVTRIYRKYIDKYIVNPNGYRVDKKDLDDLVSLYTRGGNCEGYLFEKNNKNMITFSNPSYSSVKDKVDKLTDGELKKIPLDFEISLSEDQKTIVKATYLNNEGEKKLLSFEYEDCGQKAINSALSEESVIKQFSKTGGTCFEVKDIKVALGESVFMPNGQLNSIRRRTLDAIKSDIINDYKREEADIVVNSKHATTDTQINTYENYSINVSINNIHQLEEVISNELVTGVIIPLELADEIRNNKITDGIKRLASSFKWYISFPLILRDTTKGISYNKAIEIYKDFELHMKSTFDVEVSGVYISNYEALFALNSINYDKEIIGDIHLYCTNNLAYKKLKEFNVSKTTVPVELSYNELKKRAIAGEEFIIYGKMPMMVTSNCVVNSLKNCSYRNDGNLWYINDRKNSSIPVVTSCKSCTNVIYNSVPTSLASELSSILSLNPASLRISFTDEDAKTTRKILDKLRDIMISGDNKLEVCEKYTKGHFKKGVL